MQTHLQNAVPLRRRSCNGCRRRRQEHQARREALQEARVDVGQQVEKEYDEVELVHVRQQYQARDAKYTEVRQQLVLLRPLRVDGEDGDDVVGRAVDYLDGEDDPEYHLYGPVVGPRVVHGDKLNLSDSQGP
eukprot:UN3740